MIWTFKNISYMDSSIVQNEEEEEEEAEAGNGRRHSGTKPKKRSRHANIQNQ